MNNLKTTDNNGNPGYRPKTKSKEFYDDEIIGVFPDGVIYLKEGVRRRPFNPLEEDQEIAYFNFKQTLLTIKNKIEEQVDYDNNFN